MRIRTVKLHCAHDDVHVVEDMQLVDLVLQKRPIGAGSKPGSRCPMKFSWHDDSMRGGESTTSRS